MVKVNLFSLHTKKACGGVKI